MRQDLKQQVKVANDPDEKADLNRQWEEIKIPYDLSCVSNQDLENYLSDMQIAQQYAALNRQRMAQTILKAMKWE